MFSSLCVQVFEQPPALTNKTLGTSLRLHQITKLASSATMPSPDGAAEAAPLNDMRAKIMAIMRDTTLTEEEKAKKRQELMMGGSKWAAKPEDSPANKKEAGPSKGELRRVACTRCCKGWRTTCLVPQLQFQTSRLVALLCSCPDTPCKAFMHNEHEYVDCY